MCYVCIMCVSCMYHVCVSCMVKLFVFFSNNMLYPKEDKERKVLLYAVSETIPSLCLVCY